MEMHLQPGHLATSLSPRPPEVIAQNYGDSPPVTVERAAADLQTSRQLHIQRIPLWSLVPALWVSPTKYLGLLRNLSLSKKRIFTGSSCHHGDQISRSRLMIITIIIGSGMDSGREEIGAVQ